MASEWTPKVGDRVKDIETSGRLGTIKAIRMDKFIVVDVDDAGFWTFVKSELEPAIDTPPVAASTRLTFDWKGISEENLLQLQTVLEDIMANDDGYAGWVAEMHFSLVADADEKEWRTAQHGE